MNIIRDEEMFGLMMIPLFNQWGIKSVGQIMDYIKD